MRYIETICVNDGEIKYLEYHLRRVESTIGRTLPIQQLDVPETMREGKVKMRIVYSRQEGIEEVSFENYRIKTISHLQCVDIGSYSYSHKQENRAYLNALHAACAPQEDALLIKNGFVSDTTFCNIVFLKKGNLYTPDTPLLAGTCRARLLDEHKIQAIPIRVEEIPTFEKAYLINAMIGVKELIVDIANIHIEK